MATENPMLTMIREVCSLGRAELKRPRTQDGDNDAQRQLVTGLEARGPEGDPADISLSLDLLAPRAPYFDELVINAIDRQIPQIVNLGAGYDDRALRFRHPGTSFYELDLPHIIADKINRLETMKVDRRDVHLAAIDFARDDVATVLADMGHDATRPTFFYAEHLALFLQPTDLARLFAGIATRATAKSSLALTAETHPAGLDSASIVATTDNVMFGGRGPLHSIMSLPQWDSVLAAAGWDIEDAGAFVDHFTLSFVGEEVQIQTRFIDAKLDNTDLVVR